MTTDLDDGTPLRDWGLGRFQRLPRPVLQRMFGHLYPGRQMETLTLNLAEDVFIKAHGFGTFTLADFQRTGDPDA